MCTICQALNPSDLLKGHDDGTWPSVTPPSGPAPETTYSETTPVEAGFVESMPGVAFANFPEGGDAPDDSSTSYSLADGDTFSGTISNGADVDWIEVTLTDGAHLIATMDSVSLAPTTTFLQIVDSTGNVLADELYFDLDESTSIYYNTTGATQTVYIAAGSFGTATGDYVVTADIQEYEVGTNQEIAEYLTTGWFGTEVSWDIGPGDTIDVFFDSLVGGTTFFGGESFTGQDVEDMILDALDAWTFVTGIEFNEVSSGGAGVMTFSDDQIGAFAGPSLNGDSEITTASVNVGDLPTFFGGPPAGTTWIEYFGLGVGSYSFLTFMHEIGHALGLDHSGPYNGSATYSATPGGDNVFINDTYQATIMSYFTLEDWTGVPDDFYYPVTPMIADILAAQLLYGVDGTLRDTDTVYGFGSTAGGYYDDLVTIDLPVGLTIIDDGGEDTFDFSLVTNNSILNLTPGSISSVGGSTNNVVIFDTTVIEHAILGSGDDEMMGNDADNSLDGGEGDDTINGGAGDDTIVGGMGSDDLDGGAGAGDWLSYATSAAGVEISLGTNTASGGDAAGDVISGFENVEGSDNDDSLLGSGGVNTILGFDGDDFINASNGNDSVDGGAGDDSIVGGAGADTLEGGTDGPLGDSLIYTNSNAGVSVDLQAQTATGGHATGDIISGFENVLGSVHGDILTAALSGSSLGGFNGNDTLVGSNGDSTISGGLGNDTIIAAGGADDINGGGGFDTVDYSGSFAAVTVGINNTGTVSGGYAQGDVLSLIENLIGTNLDDELTGNTLRNILTGNDGADTFNGSSNNDQLYGGGGDDLLIGSAGADTIDGGADEDTASYSNSAARVTVDLNAGTAIGSGHGAGDTLIDIEHVIGSRFNDDIFGDSGNNTLTGLNGNDDLYGGDGDDRLIGGGGTDTLYGGAGDDTMSGSSGVDSFIFDSADIGNDVITDFANNQELIDMSGSGYVISDLTVSQSGGNTVITISGTTHSITLLGVTALIDENDFIF